MRWLEKLRLASVSYWTIGPAFAVMTVMHWRWLRRSVHAGEALSAYGAALVVVGVWLAARPYIRAGIIGMLTQQVRPGVGLMIATKGGPEGLAEARADYERRVSAALPGILADVFAERILAVVFVVLGTLLNGWGTPLARRWGWPV